MRKVILKRLLLLYLLFWKAVIFTLLYLGVDPGQLTSQDAFTLATVIFPISAYLLTMIKDIVKNQERLSVIDTSIIRWFHMMLYSLLITIYGLSICFIIYKAILHELELNDAQKYLTLSESVLGIYLATIVNSLFKQE